MSESQTADRLTRPTPLAPDAIDQDIEKEVDVVVPPRRKGTIQVQLRYGGRRKPIPVEFPDDDCEEIEGSR